MASGIGVLVSERIAAATVEDNRIVGEVHTFPPDHLETDALLGIPAEVLVEKIIDVIRPSLANAQPGFVGVGFPGIVRNGSIEDSPNLVQLKGQPMQALLESALRHIGVDLAVPIFNDADVVAAGLAAKSDQLDRLIRVWTLGNGIGYGRYPFLEGVWEGGHVVVSLDPKEQYCGCGGRGHLEGIMGNRSMRLRFMDLEPDEVFDQAAKGEQRCVDFIKRWHRALAAATATIIHLDGPGKFFITGMNARFLNVSLLAEYLHEMVKLSPLQGYSLEVVPGGEEIALIGAAVNAARARARHA
jgi:predicted NBD/HSP70 family sugar kinase